MSNVLYHYYSRDHAGSTREGLIFEQQEKCKYTFSTNNELAKYVSEFLNNCLKCKPSLSFSN